MRNWMQVLIAVFVVMAMVMGWAPMSTELVPSVSAAATLGDVNGSGTIDTADAVLVLQYAAKLIDEKSMNVEAADVNGDKTIDTADAVLILQHAAKLIDSFPASGTDTPAEPVRKTPTLQPDPEDLTKATEAVVNPSPDTFCNPINISYAYQSDADEGYREGADPLVQVFNNEYYLFVSHAGGYWWSTDLVDWQFIACTDAEMDKWAPATCVVDGVMYLTHSQGGAIFKSSDPKSGKWTRVGKPVSWDDPALWYDEDGYVYCYYGCSNVSPLYVVKLDPKNNMKAVGDPIECFYANMAGHGFENGGDGNENVSGDCWLEGAWMVKHEGRYYLNYAGPGTQFATYADGCYVADEPMGPFTYCSSNPVSFKASGFLVGAGHGATFQDLFGNWWKVDTVSISQHAAWERRIELIPLTYDKNGNQITDTVFLDYPTYVPALVENNFGDAAQPDWNLLSYGVEATASSTLDRTHSTAQAVDESIRTWWSAKTGDADEWYQIDLGRLCAVNAVQVNFADEGAQKVAGRRNTFCYNYTVEFSQDGEHWYMLADHTGVTAKTLEAKDTSHDYYELVSAVGARYLRVTNKGAIPANGKFALSGLRVFGNARGTAPAAPEGLKVNRPSADERTVRLSWNAVDGAEGYIVRFGYDPEVLNLSYQVIGDTKATLRMLSMGVDYWFTVDSYNSSGYTKGTTLEHAAATREAPADRPVNQPVTPAETVVDGYTVYEAEEGTLGNGAVRSASSEDASASGRATVHNMHLDGAYIEFVNVDGGKGGAATLHIAFSNGNPSANMEVIVNGKSQVVKLSNSGGWDKYMSMDFDISGLTAGETNTIRLVGGLDAGFNPDFIQVIYAK